MSIVEFREQMKHNRSTLYHYLKDTGLEIHGTKKGRGNYRVFRIPYKWDESYLIINTTRITNFESLTLYSNELVVEFMMYGDCQINIPYKDIKYIEVAREMDVAYEGLHLND